MPAGAALALRAILGRGRAEDALAERRTGLDLVDPEERVRFSTSDLGKDRINLTLFCPTRVAAALGRAIVRELTGALHERAQGSTEKSAQR